MSRRRLQATRGQKRARISQGKEWGRLISAGTRKCGSRASLVQLRLGEVTGVAQGWLGPGRRRSDGLSEQVSSVAHLPKRRPCTPLSR